MKSIWRKSALTPSGKRAGRSRSNWLTAEMPSRARRMRARMPKMMRVGSMGMPPGRGCAARHYILRERVACDVTQGYRRQPTAEGGCMRLHGSGQGVRGAVVACLVLVVSGCANLGAVRDFASTSSDAVQYSHLVSAYAGTPTRLKRYEPQSQWPELDRQTTEREGQRERLLLRQKLIQEYMDALGQLAADDLATYDNQLDTLGAAVKNAKFADQNEAAAFSAVSKLLVSAVTDRWRQGKLVGLIEQTEAPFQTVMGAMVTIVEKDFGSDVANERVALDKYYTTLQREGRDPAGLAALAEWREMRDGQLRERESAISSYTTVLKTIAAGHHKLYESRHELSKPEIKAEIHTYTRRLKEASTAIARL